ncbi:MAG: hypothetical protein GY702_22675 [Desulfobulbaceae bacterium]|nr:hypothetical protein [Desulfobulbaceae bacterium]
MRALLLAALLAVPGPTPEFVGAIVRDRADQFHADQTIPVTWFLADGWAEWEADQVEVLPPGPATAVPSSAEWVDLGHGVAGPSVMLAIRGCESGGDYGVKNAHSSASGAWQFLTGTWEWVTGTPAPASAYPPEVQDAAAVRLMTMAGGGSSHWSESRGCWG